MTFFRKACGFVSGHIPDNKAAKVRIQTKKSRLISGLYCRLEVVNNPRANARNIQISLNGLKFTLKQRPKYNDESE